MYKDVLIASTAKWTRAYNLICIDYQVFAQPLKLLKTFLHMENMYYAVIIR